MLSNSPTLDFTRRRRLPLMLQSEASECGLACLAMVAGWHGLDTDIATLRASHSVSLRGCTMRDLARVATSLQLVPRAVRLDLPQLAQLQLPCVLHWDFSHFVVLERIGDRGATIHDPAQGRRTVSHDELSRRFTGVALEATPAHDFRPRVERRPVRLAGLVGPLPGAGTALTQLLVLALSLQAIAMLAPFYLQWVVDQALVADDRDLVTVLALGFGLLVLIQAAATGLRGWMLVVLGTALNMQLQSNLFRHLVRLPLAWFERRHIGDVVSRFESLNAIQRALTGSAAEALIDGVTAIATLGLMLFYSPMLSAVALAAAVLYIALRLALYRPLRGATEEQIVRTARQQTHFIESVRGMQCLKLFAHEQRRVGEWLNLAAERFNAGVRTQRLTVVYQALNGLVFGLENVVTIALGARLALDGAGAHGFSVGMLFAFVSYKTQFVQRVGTLVDKGLELRMLSLHTERVADVAHAPQEPVDDARATRDDDPVTGAVELDNVSFRYAESDPLVLDRVNLRIEEGESVAIVGASGSGKTTLVKVLLGLLTPAEGRVLVGGRPLAQVGLQHFRAGVASVMQDDLLFAGSIGDNITFFDPQPDQSRIEECARVACVLDDIRAMPMRFDTLVGDMGTVLSGGQKQRVLLARALYRRPRILVLDEATSHLDVARERAVNEAVKALRLTRIIVAHRPETIASADRVVVLAQGRAGNALAVVDGGAGAARA